MFFATPHSKDGGASAPPFLWIKKQETRNERTEDRCQEF